VPGVTRAAPLIKGKLMVSDGEDTTGAEVYGMLPENFAAIPRVGAGSEAIGDLARYPDGIAVGSGIARELGITVGDRVRLIAPSGVRTAMGTSPRVNAYEVVYIFTAGRYDIDTTRIYMPFNEAQSFFNKEGLADEIEVMVETPDAIESYGNAILEAAGPSAMLWTWKDSSGAFLRALDIEDNVMFVILSVLVLIAAMNIVSGLIMLVKNKGRDIGILRTMGLTEGSVLRVFFICGAFTGVIGTVAGVVLGCLTALNIDQIMSFLNWVNGAEVWDPSIRGIYSLPAKLQLGDVMSAVALSLGLSFIVTLLPARRAARMNPVEALRYE
jgi:lipoprotein-releasing system permease protein